MKKPKSQQARDLKAAEPTITVAETQARLKMSRQAVESAWRFDTSKPGRKRRERCHHCGGSGFEPQRTWAVADLSARSQRVLAHLGISTAAEVLAAGRKGIKAAPGAGEVTLEEISDLLWECGYGRL